MRACSPGQSVIELVICEGFQLLALRDASDHWWIKHWASQHTAAVAIDLLYATVNETSWIQHAIKAAHQDQPCMPSSIQAVLHLNPVP